MLNMTNKSKWGALRRVVLAAALLAGSTAALAADVTFNLWAKAGTMSLPGVADPVNVWGYTDSDVALVGKPGGPTLIVNQDDVVTVNLTNTLPPTNVPTDPPAPRIGLLFQGQAMVPDTVGALPAGGVKIYKFTATRPGTYLYEAGLSPNSQPQVAMGLYGALVVRPATALQAYADAATAYNDEAVLVLSELDTALNANPGIFDMRNFAPQYFLINGKPYPNTDVIPSVAGNKLLLRYVNAGVKHHSMAVLGLRQNFVAKDGSVLPTLSRNVAAETLAPGQTADAIVSVPSTATTASRFAVYDASLNLHNSITAGMGGMLTFVTAGTGAPVTGPASTAVTLAPNASNGSAAVVLSASVSSAASTVTAAEYFVDATAVSGTGVVMAGTLPSASATVSATLSGTDQAVLASGNHTLYVHAKDANDLWGPFSSTVLRLDKAGPLMTGLTLSPNPSNGSVAVNLSASANDSSTGNSNITAAQYTVDGGAAVPMTVNVLNTPVASVSAVIPAVLILGPHTVAVSAQDALGNWGPATNITLNVVASGPVTSAVSASKNPNNGALALSSTQPVVRVAASFTASAGVTVGAAEAFIDAVGALGSGFPFVPTDGSWNSITELGYADIPLATVNALSAGNHVISVRAKDSAGNWGVVATTTLVIDKTAPTASIARVGASPSNLATVQFLVTYSKVVFGGAASNFSLVTSGLTGTSIASVTGTGTTRTVTVNAGSGAGNLGLNMTSTTGVSDLAGNGVAPLPVTGAVYAIDRQAPTVSSINRVGTNPTNAASVQFQVNFSEIVNGVTAANFSLTTTGGVTGAAITSVSGSGNTRTVTVSTGSGAGTIRLNKSSSAGITDVIGNAMTSGNFNGGQSFTIDKIAPTVSSINRIGASPTNAASVQFLVTFSETVTGVTAARFTLTTVGVTGASITSVAGNGSTRTVTVNTGTGSGTLRLDKTSNTGIVDAAGNAMTSGNFTTGLPYTKL